MSGEMPEKWFQQVCEQHTRLVDAFSQTVNRFIEHDESNHRQFRETIGKLTTAVELLRAEQGHQKENWNRVWAVAIAPVLAGIVIAVLALVLK